MKMLGKIERVHFGTAPSPAPNTGEVGLFLGFLYGQAGSRKKITTFITIMSEVGEALRSAGVTDIHDLHNKPVEVDVYLEHGNETLTSWRVLAEVL